MIHSRTSRSARAIVTIAFALALVVALAGCGNKATTDATQPAAQTGLSAKAGLPLAASALATMAPDAKLLVVQTADAVTTTSTPVWSYLFGSPKDDKTYLVYVENGKAMPASEYGTAGLKKAEWDKVPNADDWKIDSEAAAKSARAAAGASATSAYTMGFLTYVPSDDKKTTTKVFTWYVSFDPTSGATTGTVEVDANTGEVVGK